MAARTGERKNRKGRLNRYRKMVLGGKCGKTSWMYAWRQKIEINA
jgi:hypothetical protein